MRNLLPVLKFSLGVLGIEIRLGVLCVSAQMKLESCSRRCKYTPNCERKWEEKNTSSGFEISIP